MESRQEVWGLVLEVTNLANKPPGIVPTSEIAKNIPILGPENPSAPSKKTTATTVKVLAVALAKHNANKKQRNPFL